MKFQYARKRMCETNNISNQIIPDFEDDETSERSSSISTGPPRAVRILSLGSDGAPQDGLLVIEVGTRLVFSMRPNDTVSMVCCYS